MGKVAALLARARSVPHFGIGLKRIGFELAEVPKEKPNEDDVLVIWNRLATTDPHAKRYEAVGARVIVVEHGWIGKHTYAVCLGQHNGAGWWPVGNVSRWPIFGIEEKPYRTKGEHILVVPQRGMGIPPVGMPRDWLEKTLPQLEKATNRPIMVKHPASREEAVEPYFKDCHATLIWASGAGIKSIVAGCPVFYGMEAWIGRMAASPLELADLEYPNTDPWQRHYMLHRLSWAMWLPHEIESGEPFERLLDAR